ALATGVAAADAVTALRAFAKHGEVMIVGHEPQLSAIASILLTGAGDAAHLRLKTGGCIAIDLPARFERGGGVLRGMLAHRQLRQMRKESNALSVALAGPNTRDPNPSGRHA